MRSGPPGSTICVSEVQLMTTMVKGVELKKLIFILLRRDRRNHCKSALSSWQISVPAYDDEKY